MRRVRGLLAKGENKAPGRQAGGRADRRNVAEHDIRPPAEMLLFAGSDVRGT